MPSASHNRTTVRLPVSVTDRLTADPIARLNLSAFVRVVVDGFIASGNPLETTRAHCIRLASKTDATPTSLAVPAQEFRHYRHYAAAAGGHTIGALVCSALVLHYFGPASFAPTPPTSPPTVQCKDGYRPFLLSFALGQTRELTAADVPTDLSRAQLALFATSEFIRESLPDFRITTRRTAESLVVTRVT